MHAQKLLYLRFREKRGLDRMQGSKPIVDIQYDACITLYFAHPRNIQSVVVRAFATPPTSVTVWVTSAGVTSPAISLLAGVRAQHTSDVAIRFSDADFLKESNKFAIRHVFRHTVQIEYVPYFGFRSI